jgi:F-type H+-transporting ATPase subunit b
VRQTGTPRAISLRRPSTQSVRGRAAAITVAASVVFMLAAALDGGGRHGGAVAMAAQPGHPPTAVSQEHAAGQEHAEPGASHGASSPWTLVARLFNFAVLAGVLVYFLRSPFMAFLAARGAEIRAELVKAADLNRKAADRLAESDRRLAALPAELAALRARGVEEAAAEDARIRSAAEAERARLVEQGRRRIDNRLRVARRDLAAHAARRAVDVAEERIRRTMRPDDQRRLVEAYLGQVGAASAFRRGPTPAPPAGGPP